MGKLYDDVMSVIDFQLDKDTKNAEERFLIKGRKVLYYLFFANIIVLSFAIFCIIDEFPLGFLIFPIFSLVSVAFLKHRGIKKQKQINVLMYDECNFTKLLTIYLVRIRYHGASQKARHVLLWNTSSSLFYLGRFEEGKRVIDLVKKYCDTPKGKAARLFYYAMVARIGMDKEKVNDCIKELDAVMPNIKTPYIIKTYDTISKYPIGIEAEEKGDYHKAKELIKQDEKQGTLLKLSANYRLYKVAIAAGMNDKAKEHRAFIIKNGGDTFFKKELINENS